METAYQYLPVDALASGVLALKPYASVNWNSNSSDFRRPQNLHPPCILRDSPTLAWLWGALARSCPSLGTELCQNGKCFFDEFPGSGKTFFCRNFLIPCVEHHTSVCMAPTNRAAINLNGKTIHSHFGVHAEEEDDHRYAGNFYKRQAHPDCYIVDECSMLDASLWDIVHSFALASHSDQ